VADPAVLADGALGVRLLLLEREQLPPLAARNFAPAIGFQVAQLPSALHEKVAGIHVAVVLHHHVAVAAFVERAGARLLARQRFGDVIEEAHPHAPPLRPPLVEDRAQKAPVLLRGNSKRHGRTVGVKLGQRNELKVADAELAEERVEVIPETHIGFAHYAQDVEFHLLPLEQLDGFHHLRPRGVSGFVIAVAVVRVLRPIQRKPYQKVVLPKQLAPGAVQQNAVRLQRIADA
jgi:hypothetical protein